MAKVLGHEHFEMLEQKGSLTSFIMV